jgi:guanyl-specific ribonuclease Sa
MKKILLTVLASSGLFLNAADVVNKDLNTNPVNQISTYAEKADLTTIKNDVNLTIDLSLSNDEKSACQYPNDGLNYGTDVTPKITDPVRVNAIVSLVTKIIKCEKLPYKEDGQIFTNKEGLLPQMEKGYYREYTLIIPSGSQKEFNVGDTHFTAYPSYSGRGPERIVIGGGSIIYYTPTHYDSFIQIKLINKSDK